LDFGLTRGLFIRDASHALNPTYDPTIYRTRIGWSIYRWCVSRKKLPRHPLYPAFDAGDRPNHHKDQGCGQNNGCAGCDVRLIRKIQTCHRRNERQPPRAASSSTTAGEQKGRPDGVTSMASINASPTVCRDTTIATAIRINRTLSSSGGQAQVGSHTGSNARIMNSCKREISQQVCPPKMAVSNRSFGPTPARHRKKM